MAINITVEMCAHRTLKRVESYYKTSEAPENLSCSIPDGQKIIGVYKNDSQIENEIVIVTNKSLLLVSDNDITRVDYKDIKYSDWYPEDKRVADTIKITLDNNNELYIPIKGKSSGYSDVFEFIHFLGKCMSVCKQ